MKRTTNNAKRLKNKAMKYKLSLTIDFEKEKPFLNPETFQLCSVPDSMICTPTMRCVIEEKKNSDIEELKYSNEEENGFTESETEYIIHNNCYYKTITICFCFQKKLKQHEDTNFCFCECDCIWKKLN